MKCLLRTEQEVRQLSSAIQEPAGKIFCQNHDFCCNKYALFCSSNTVKASYKTYALVYLFQLVTNSKKFRQQPKKEIPKFIWNYIKSVSFTAVDFAIMRRVMCFYNQKIGGNSKCLIISNILGGLYLAVQSKNRQIQITLYSINKAIQTLYNMHKRRNPNFKVPYGQAFLFAVSISIICYHYFNNRQVIRPAYQKAFGTILKGI